MGTTLPSSSNTHKKKILRVGIIGCGKIFQSHCQAYPDHQHAVVVGFYDRIHIRAEEWFQKFVGYMQSLEEASQQEDEEGMVHLERCRIFNKEARVYDDVQSLIDAVDVLDICAPNYTHTPYATWALMQGKSVMSEKPAARCSLETQALVDICAKSKAHYQINENFFWQLYVRKLHELVQTGQIGEIQSINMQLGHGSPSWGWQNHFLNPSLSGGGTFTDLGFHALGLVFGVLGADWDVEKVQSLHMATGSQKERTLQDDKTGESNEYYVPKYLVEDEARVQFWLSSALQSLVKVVIETSWSKTMRSFEILGTKGKYTIDYVDKKVPVIFFSPSSSSSTDGIREEITSSPQGRDSHQLEVVDFLTRIAHNKKSSVDEHLAHKMQSIISSAYLSNLQGGKVITPQDLTTFYQTFQESRCPSTMVMEEIVYAFMRPFTRVFKTAE